MNMRELINLFEAPTPAQGVTGQKLAQTSGGQFVNRADRTNQAKVDAALGPGFKAGSAAANQALAKKFSQPQSAPAAAPANTASAQQSAALDASKANAIGGQQAASPAAPYGGAAANAMAAKSAPQQTTPDQIPTQTATTAQSIGATNLQGENPAGQETPASIPTQTATTAQSIGATNLQGENPAQQNTAAPASAGGYAQSATAATNNPLPKSDYQPVAGSSNLVSRTADKIAADTKAGPFGAQQNQATKSYASVGDFASAIGDKVKGFFGGSKAAPAAAQGPVNNQSSGMTAQSQAQKSPEPTQTATPVPSQTSDQIATAALNAPAQDTSGTSLGTPAAFGKMAEADAPATPAPQQPTPKTQKSPSMYDVDKANRKEIASQFDPNSTYVNPHDKDTRASAPGSKAVNTMADFEEDINNELAEMMRLSGLTLKEKAPPGAKAERMVKHIKKGYAKDGKLTDKEKSIAFATAWKQHNKEKVNEGMDIMLDEGGHTLKHIVNRFKHETKNFMNTGFMAENLYDALYDYYLDRGDMPYGIAKAREGDPYEWVEEHFYADMGSQMSEGTVAEQTVDPLSELARLAGLHEDGPGASRLYGDGKKPSSTFNPIDTLKQVANKGIDLYNKREQARKDYWDSIKWADGSGGKPGGSGAVADLVPKFQTDADTRFADKDKTSAPIATPAATKADAFKDAMGSGSSKAQADDKLKECGDAMPMKDHSMQKDRLNVTTNMSSDGTKDVTINAQGDAAEDLLSMLKLAGMERSAKPTMVMIDQDEEMMEADRVSEYENTPEEEYQTIDSILRQGNDLNREKRQYKKEYPGDNPMAESILDADLNDILESILIRDDKDEPEIKRDPETGRVSATFPPPKRRDPASQEIPMEPESPESRTTGPRSMKVPGERTGTENYSKDKEVDEGWEDVSNFFGDLVGTEASHLRHSEQLRDLDKMRQQYKGTPYEKQVQDRYDTHLERRRQDKGEVVDKTGEPIKVLPPDQWKGGK